MDEDKQDLTKERTQILGLLNKWLELPMAILGFIWLILLIIDLTRGLGPYLLFLSNTIWIVFILNFLIEFILAPIKKDYLKNNWMTIIALALPALRALRIVRAVRMLRLARSARGVRLLSLLTSIRRGMQTLGSFLGRRGFGYVLSVTVMVNILGAAGMYAFEKGVEAGNGINSFGEALWWTAMIMTTMGSSYWPETAEGKIVCLLLSIYALGVFSYFAGTLASYFITSEQKSSRDGEKDN